MRDGYTIFQAVSLWLDLLYLPKESDIFDTILIQRYAILTIVNIGKTKRTYGMHSIPIMAQKLRNVANAHHRSWRENDGIRVRPASIYTKYRHCQQ